MALFHILIGAMLGMGVGGNGEIVPIIVFSSLSAAFLIFTYKRRQLPYFLIPFLLFLTIGLINRLLPPAGQTSVTMVVTRVSDDYYIGFSGLKGYYVSAKGHSVDIFDIVTLEGKDIAYEATRYEGRFYFGDYLATLGVHDELVVRSSKSVFANPIRLHAYQKSFLSNFSQEASSLISALAFGKKDYSSSLILQASEMDLLFILSSSGLFYSFFLRIFEKGISYRLKDKTIELSCLIFALLLLPLGMTKVGYWRVFLGRLIRFLNKWKLKDKLTLLDSISISGIILLCLNPFLPMQQGFLLGYGISLSFCFSSYLKKEKNPLINKIKALMLIRGFLLPISLSKGSIHLSSFIYMFILLPFSFSFSLLAHISFYTYPLKGMLNGYASFISGMVDTLSKYDIPISLSSIGFIGVLTYYVIYFIVLVLNEYRMVKIRRILILGATSIYAISLIPFSYLCCASIHFINVGQGDCTLIQYRSAVAMIDTGGVVGVDLAQETLIPYLRKQRIYHIDCLFITHRDYDHYGAMDSLIRNFDVKRVVEDKDEFPVKLHGLTFSNYNVYQWKESNDSSLVLSLDLLDKKWLFTGDAPSEVEKLIIKDNPSLDCDILKLGHHGSDTSSCAEFLDAVTPEVAIVSCGKKNKYGHPSAKVLQRLKERNIKLRRTDIEGTIVYRGFA